MDYVSAVPLQAPAISDSQWMMLLCCFAEMTDALRDANINIPQKLQELEMTKEEEKQQFESAMSLAHPFSHAIYDTDFDPRSAPL